MAENPDIPKIGKRIEKVMNAAADRVLTLAAAYAADRIIVPGGKALPVDGEKLTNRSGRLLRALNSIADGRGREGRRFVQRTQGSIRFGYELDVPWAGHDRGISIPAYSTLTTARQRAFFWAMYYKTKTAMWKAMALKRGLTHSARTIKARPYATPGAEEAAGEFPAVLQHELTAEFGS